MTSQKNYHFRRAKQCPLRASLFQLLSPSKAILVVSKVKTSNSNLFGSAFQN